MISEALDNIRSMTSKMNPAVIYRTNDGLVAVMEDASQAEALIVFDVEDDSEIQIKASKAIQSAIEAQRNVDDLDIYGNVLVDSAQTYSAKPLLTDERTTNADEYKALPGRLQIQVGTTCYAYVSTAVIQQFDATKHNTPVIMVVLQQNSTTGCRKIAQVANLMILLRVFKLLVGRFRGEELYHTTVLKAEQILVIHTI